MDLEQRERSIIALDVEYLHYPKNGGNRISQLRIYTISIEIKIPVTY